MIKFMKSSVSQGGCLSLLILQKNQAPSLFATFLCRYTVICMLICKACATPVLPEHLITLLEIQIICETSSNVFCMSNKPPPHPQYL